MLPRPRRSVPRPRRSVPFTGGDGRWDGTLPLVAAQFADGAGAKFHLVALSLYVLHHGGLGAVSGFIASGLLGSVVAVAAAAGTTRVISGRTLMAAAATTLLAARIVAYVVIAAGAGAVWLFVGQFVGSVAGTLLINCSKAQAPPGRRARTLAWMNVSNGAGGIIGAGAAGILSIGWPTLAIVAVGVVGATVATAPMMVLSRRSATVPVSFRDQWSAARGVVGPMLLGAAVFAFVGGFDLLRNGLVAELFDARFIALATAAAVVGSWSAAATVGWFERLAKRVPATVLWPATGAVPVALWGLAPSHLGVLLVAVALGALMLGWMAVSVEAAILERTGSAATAALSLSTAVAALLSAGTVQAVPRLLERSGHLATSGVLLVGLLAVALAATTIGFLGLRHSRRTRVASVVPHGPASVFPHGPASVLPHGPASVVPLEPASAGLPTYSSAAP